MSHALHYAARSDVGLVRSENQDSAYAGPHLLVVADGMGGHAGGDIASSTAIGYLVELDDESHSANESGDELFQAIAKANAEIGRIAVDRPEGCNWPLRRARRRCPWAGSSRWTSSSAQRPASRSRPRWQSMPTCRPTAMA